MVAGLLLLSMTDAHAQSVPKDFLIKLTRTACYGVCPVYDVMVDADGRVTYRGDEHVGVKGRHTASIPRSKVETLAAAVDKSGFFAMKDDYGAQITDLPTTYVTVTMDGRTKTIRDYANAPPALEQLERDIDDILGTRRWISPGKPQAIIDSPATRDRASSRSG
jgi:hypothetical protein